MLNAFYRNRQLLWLSISLIIVWGLSSFLTLPRLEDPEITPRFASITTVWPGASAPRVESLVTDIIEKELQDIEEIDEVDSFSGLSLSSIGIELKDSVTDVDPIWARVRSELEEVTADLPSDAQAPEFEQGNLKASAIIVGLAWDLPAKPNYAILNRVSDALADQIRAIPGTEEVERFGEPTEEILVTVDPQAIADLGITASALARQLESSDAKVSSGNIRGDRDEFLLEVNSQIESLERIKQTPLRSSQQGQVASLSDVAQVTKGIREPLESLSIVNGQPGIILSATVESQERVDQWAKSAKSLLSEFEANLSDGLSLTLIQDQSQYVKQRLNGVISNLLISSGLVVGISLVLLGWRASVIVGLALPLVTLTVFGLMKSFGIPLHQMSITGLIIALGLLIDNAIIVVDEVQHRVWQGNQPGESVQQTVKHLGIPLLASTLTTVFAFVPIASSAGGTGEFIGTIGLTVILSLISSLCISLTVIASLAAMTTAKGAKEPPKFWLRRILAQGISFPWLSRIFRRSLRIVLSRPVLGILVALVLPVLGFSQFVTLEQQFFPPTNRNQIEVEIEMPASTAIAQTKEIAESARDLISDHPKVDDVQWFIGESAPRFFYNIVGLRQNAPDYAQGIITISDPSQLKTTIQTLQNDLESAYPQAQVLVKQLEQGPPFGAPIEARLTGPDIEQLRLLGNELRSVLAMTPKIVQTRASLTESLPKFSLTVDEAQAQQVGLTNEAIARQLEASLEGQVGGSLLEDTEELPVRVRMSDERRGQLNQIESITLTGDGPNGGTRLPLDAIADVSLQPEVSSIIRLNGERLNTIQGFIEAGALPDTVLRDFQERLDQSNFQLPSGYRLTYGGEADARGTAVGNLLSTVGLLLILMTATLVLSFNSFILAGIIAAIAILSIGLGAFALWSFQSIFGFTAILGMLGLIGLAINDSIVVLAAIREEPLASQGYPRAIERVVFNSARHVLATTLTTIMGLGPLMFDSTGFWPPLAITIAGGLGGATILALYFVPCIYVIYAKLVKLKPETITALTPQIQKTVEATSSEIPST